MQHLKENWPLYVGGALVLIALYYFMSSSNSGGSSYTIGSTSTADASKVAQAELSAQQAQQASVAQAFSQYLDYLVQSQSIGAQEYNTYTQAVSNEFTVSQAVLAQQEQYAAQLQAATLAKPSGWQTFLNFLAQIGPTIASAFTGMPNLGQTASGKGSFQGTMFNPNTNSPYAFGQVF